MSWLVIIALSAAPMEEGMRDYFGGETAESFVFMGAGLGGIGSGLGLFLEHGAVGRPMSIPLMAFGLIDLVLGVGLFFRTPKQVEGLAEQLSKDPAAYREAETKRMAGVMNGFQIYRAFELTVATAGAVMGGIGYVRNEATVCGVGLGLLIEAGVLLALDFFAEERGRKYSALLADFRP